MSACMPCDHACHVIYVQYPSDARYDEWYDEEIGDSVGNQVYISHDMYKDIDRPLARTFG